MAQVSSSKLPPNARLVNSPIPPPYSPLTPFANHPSSSTSKTLSAAPNTALLRAEMSGPSPQNQVHFNLKPLFEPFPGYGRPRLGQPYRGFCQAMLKRHRKAVRDNILGITKPDIRRLARRGGVKRIATPIYADARTAIKDRLTEVLRQITLVMDSAPLPGRKTITSNDVSKPKVNVYLPTGIFRPKKPEVPVEPMGPQEGDDELTKCIRMTEQVVYALKRLGTPIYGFDKAKMQRKLYA